MKINDQEVKTRVKLISWVFSSGERFPVLVDEQSLPFSLPLRYCVDELRARRQVQTIKSRLRAICFFYEWAFEQNSVFDPEVRLRSGELLSRGEIAGLCRFVRSGRANKIEYIGLKPIRPGESKSILSNGTFNCYMMFIKDFLIWAARNEKIDSVNESDIARLERFFSAEKLASTRSRRLKGLSEKEISYLLGQIEPKSANNPYRKKVRRRNYLIVKMLLETGIRRGELLKLRIEDLVIRKDRNFIKVRRRPDDPYDCRVEEPAVKTLERNIPICEELKLLLLDYLKSVRGRQKHPYLFVGTISGAPLSISSVNRIFIRLRVLKKLPEITPHTMRRSFNGRIFRKTMDWPEEKKKKIQNYLCGWRDGSNQSEVYELEAIEEDAFKVLMEVQGGLDEKRGM